MRKITWDNFHDCTFASFTPVTAPTRKPDFLSFSGSEYWRDTLGVYRRSNHWCHGIKSCDWLLGGRYSSSEATGFCPYFRFEDKLSDKYSHKLWLQRTHERSARLRDNPLAWLEWSHPEFPLKGRGNHRITFGYLNDTNSRKAWHLIPDNHKFTWTYPSLYRAISPEAYEAVKFLLAA